MIIGGYGFNRNTGDLDIWLAPINENKSFFIQTLLCMDYSESDIAPLYERDL